MSRKHFVALADTLRHSAPFDSGSPEWAQWASMVSAIADTLSGFNPAFDRGRFIRACIPAGKDNPATWPK